MPRHTRVFFGVFGLALLVGAVFAWLTYSTPVVLPTNTVVLDGATTDAHLEFGKNRPFTVEFGLADWPYQFEYDGDDREAVAHELDHRGNQIRITVNEDDLAGAKTPIRVWRIERDGRVLATEAGVLQWARRSRQSWLGAAIVTTLLGCVGVATALFTGR